ncbi:hypothetical protein SFMTTN_1245 [Sulfuriferula multivorans]|uniref:Uncharacterized protein n=1 Tax=Sulfuriferula multivorans TaxID=1559896 RepID=A0A401JCN3_9PROT|nr:hypothetical protein [Sulfuriferula multivorans]GBL45438.1 hypothetical protein SFMTTN_1245 [Sulfuriferula multivorans]
MKKYVFSLLLFGLVSPAYATSLSGRLFYTPAQRAQIEAGRNRGTPSPADTVPDAGDTVYNGYVARSDGSTTFWINGQPRRMQPASGTPGKLKLPAIPALKPGQEFNTQYGRILEPYERPAPAVPTVQSAVPAARKTQRSPLPDGDDAPGDSSNEGDSAQPPAASEH